MHSLITHQKFIFILLSLGSSYSAMADENSQIHPTGIGFNYSVMFQEYKGHRTDTAVLPTFFYDNNHVYVEGDDAGIYLMHDDQNELRLNVYYDDKEMVPSGQLSPFKKRKWSLMAGASYMRITPIGGFKVQIGHDVLGRTHGSMVKLGYLTEYKSGQWSVYPEVGMQWNDAKYNRYYYGVSAAESAQSGLSTYNPKQSIQPYMSLNVNYDINKAWSVYMGLDAHYLAHEQYNSPMVKRHMNIEPSAGLLYWY